MPCLKIQTNRPIEESLRERLAERASKRVAQQLAKDERYVMVVVEPPCTVLFAGGAAPAAFLELKSIGLTRDQARALSASLTELLAEMLDISAERTYIEFANVERAMWGWNGVTFARDD